MRETEAITNEKIGFAVYKYPPTAGIGHETRAENVIVIDMIFACAKGSTSSTALNRSTGMIEKAARNRALSNTADRIARNIHSLGAIISTTRPRKPLA